MQKAMQLMPHADIVDLAIATTLARRQVIVTRVIDDYEAVAGLSNVRFVFSSVLVLTVDTSACNYL